MKLRFEVQAAGSRKGKIVTIEVDLAKLPDDERMLIEEKCDIDWSEWCYLVTGLKPEEGIAAFAKQHDDTIDMVKGFRVKDGETDENGWSYTQLVVTTHRPRIVAKLPTYA